jgi:hypothetical protein
MSSAVAHALADLDLEPADLLQRLNRVTETLQAITLATCAYAVIDLALYTDGLVESRTRSFDQGILAMRSILAREHGHLEAICDALIVSLAGRRPAAPAEPPGSAEAVSPCITGARAPSGSATPPHGWFRRAQE